MVVEEKAAVPQGATLQRIRSGDAGSADRSWRLTENLNLNRILNDPDQHHGLVSLASDTQNYLHHLVASN